MFGFLNNLVMLGVGSWLIMEGSEWFSLGALIAYRGFWWRLQSPIRTIAQTSDILQRASAAATRVTGSNRFNDGLGAASRRGGPLRAAAGPAHGV